MKMKKAGRFIRLILLGVAVTSLGFSGDLAMAQATSPSTLPPPTGTGIVTIKPLPGPCGRSCASVPEPASLILLGAGLAGLGIWRRASRKV